jgi:hypothetical protein
MRLGSVRHAQLAIADSIGSMGDAEHRFGEVVIVSAAKVLRGTNSDPM